VLCIQKRQQVVSLLPIQRQVDTVAPLYRPVDTAIQLRPAVYRPAAVSTGGLDRICSWAVSLRLASKTCRWQWEEIDVLRCMEWCWTGRLDRPVGDRLFPCYIPVGGGIWSWSVCACVSLATGCTLLARTVCLSLLLVHSYYWRAISWHSRIQKFKQISKKAIY